MLSVREDRVHSRASKNKRAPVVLRKIEPDSSLESSFQMRTFDLGNVWDGDLSALQQSTGGEKDVSSHPKISDPLHNPSEHHCLSGGIGVSPVRAAFHQHRWRLSVVHEP